MIGRHVIEGPSVVVPARVAYSLWRKLGLDRFRESTYRSDMEIYAVLSDWKSVFLLYQEQLLAAKDAKAGSGTSPSRKSHHDGPMTVNDVADLMKVTDSAVRLAARENRLVGSKTAKGWVFEPGDVADWIAVRTGRKNHDA